MICTEAYLNIQVPQYKPFTRETGQHKDGQWCGNCHVLTSSWLRRWNWKHRVIWNGRFFKMKAILPYGIAIDIYIWKKGQQNRIMAVIFVDRFPISVRAKVHESFTVYTVVAFAHWPRVALKSTLLWLRTTFPWFPMIPSVACEWRLPAATERGRVCSGTA